jgi:hypothetical protein
VHHVSSFADKCYVTVRMQYYDDVTPEDYQPPGFSDASDLPAMQFGDNALSLKVGGIETPFHG